jgi:hypothetical protein
MALKFKISKKDYDALSDEFKSEYIAGDNDSEFVLDVSGLPAPEDTGPLKRALEAEKNKHKETKAKLATAETTISEMPDVEALKTQHEKEVGKYKSFTEKTLIDGTATTLATKISTVPSLLAKDLKDRFVVDLSGDEPKLKIKDKDGKVSDDLTLDKLQQEVVANPEYKSIIIGSKASGGGAPRTPIKPVGGGAPNDGEPVPDLSKMKPADLAARITARKEAAAVQQ